MVNPTTRFLILSLRSPWDADALPAARALAEAGQVDWEALFERVHNEGLAPLLYYRLRGQQLLPRRLEQELRTIYYTNAQRTILLFRELEEVLRGLAAAQIPTLLLKGAALAQEVYDNPAARPLGDIDLLIRPADVPRALVLLEGLGYASGQIDVRPGTAVAYENELMLFKQAPVEVMLELHWALIDSPYYQERLSPAWLWETALPLQIGEVASRMLAPEAHLLHLCAHLLLHHGAGEQLRLLWLHDVAEMIACCSERIDWEVVLARGQAYELVLSLQQVLGRVSADWNPPIPQRVLQRLGALRPSAGERWIVAQLTAGHRPVARRFWTDLASMPAWRQRLRYAWQHLFPAPAYMRQRYRIPHPLLTPFYYPYRWLLGLRSALPKRP